MRNRFLFVYLTISCSLSMNCLQGQIASNFIDTIKSNSRLWDIAFNTRDTSTYYNLIDTAIAVTAGGGTEMGSAIFKAVTNHLYTRRPDITMYMTIANVEVNNQWKVAYDTGDWTEAWTQKNDNYKSEIKGKYWRMWKMRDNKWRIMAIILTPLSCKGSYCK